MRLYLASSSSGKLRELSALAGAEGVELETVPGYEGLTPFPEDEPSFALNALEKAVYYSRHGSVEDAPGRGPNGRSRWAEHEDSPRLEPRGSGVEAECEEGRAGNGPSGRGRWAEPGGEVRGPNDGSRRAERGSAQEGLGVSGGEKLLVVADDSGLVVEALEGQPGVRSARYAGPGATDADNNRKLLEELRGVTPEKRGARFVCVLALARGGRVLGIFSDYVEGRILEAPRGTGGFGYDPLFFLPERGCTTAELSAEEKNRVSHRGKAFRKLLAFLKKP